MGVEMAVEHKREYHWPSDYVLTSQVDEQV